MPLRRPGVRRWRGWILRSDEQQIDEELRLHIEARTDHLVAAGMAPDVAREEALRRFRDLEATRAALHADARARRRRRTVVERCGDVLRDVRYVSRALSRSPAFTAGVVATLGLGLGINSAVFRVADQALFRAPARVHDPTAVRRVETMVAFGTSAPMRATMFSWPDARTIRDGGAFEKSAVHGGTRIARGGDGRDTAVAAVDERFFPLLGVNPHAGRAFDATEGRPGAGIAVAMVSFDYWTRRLGAAAPDGSASITLGDRSYRVVGVLPRGFTGIELDPVDVWLPLGIADFGRGNVNGVVIPWYQSEMLRALRIVGRPAPGTSDALLAQRLTTMFAQADAENERPRRTAVVTPIVPAGDSRRVQGADALLARLAAVAAFVLLIACANAVNLLLARSLTRRQEIAIRLALGASRARLFRLLLVESLLLGLLGGAAAALGGAWTGDALRRLVFPDGRWSSAIFDERTLLFTALLAAAVGLAAGIVPATQAMRADLLSALKEGCGRGRPSLGLTRGLMVIVQTALSLVLLVAAGLLVLSLVRLHAVGLGFDPRGLVTASLDSFGPSADASAADVASRLPAGGAIREVALASAAPFGTTAVRDISVPGSSFVPESPRDQPQFMAVSPNFFSVLDTRLVQGRGFTAQDTRGSEPVVVVNESMARRYWGRAIPSGACILMMPGPCARVIGVVEDVHDTPGGAAAPARFYLPLDQHVRPPQAVIARTTAAQAGAAAAALRAAVPASQRMTIEVIADRVARATRPWRTSTQLFLGLGLVALALACVGIYSVTSYLVAERRHELGVRIAMGASGRDIVRHLLAGGFRLIAIGGALGLLCAAGSGRLLRTLLYDVSPFDPAVYAVALAGLLLAAFAATLAPALRASRVSPVIALRSE